MGLFILDHSNLEPHKNTAPTDYIHIHTDSRKLTWGLKTNCIMLELKHGQKMAIMYISKIFKQ